MSWAEYVRAVVRIELPDGPAQIAPAPPGRAVGAFPDVPRDVLYVVTAFNPGGLVSPEPANQQAHSALIRRLEADHVTYFEADGGDPGWTRTEAGFALIGVDEAYAKALGRDFGQDAIFEWTPTELSVLACDGERRSSAGWIMTAD
jgi:Protein of unknown function (DUF3293)